MGRPSKLDEQRLQRICKLLRQGVPRERAARIAGIDSATFRRWMMEGALPEGRDAYRTFRTKVLQAEDHLIARGMAAVSDAFAVACPECGLERELGDEEPCPSCHSDRAPAYVHELRDRTAAARFIFPHRFPQEFSTRAEVQATGPDGGPVKVEAEVKVQPLLTDAQLAALGEGQLRELVEGLVGKVAG